LLAVSVLFRGRGMCVAFLLRPGLGVVFSGSVQAGVEICIGGCRCGSISVALLLVGEGGD
jgi:hypothetical protein